MIIMANTVLDYSKDYRGKPESVKTTTLILVKADGTEVEIDADQLEALIAGS